MAVTFLKLNDAGRHRVDLNPPYCVALRGLREDGDREEHTPIGPNGVNTFDCPSSVIEIDAHD